MGFGKSGKYAHNRKYNPFTEEHWEPYLECLEATGMYVRAADAVGANLQEVIEFRKENPEFQVLCDEALERYRAKFIEEAERRAVEGWEEPVIGGRNRDQVVTKVKRYSDRLLELFLKRSSSGAFTDKQEVTVVGDMNIRQEMNLGALSKTARRMLRELLEQIQIDEANRALGKEVE